MFDNFTPFDVQTSTSPPVTIHGLRCGSPTAGRPPLLLVHGFPQSHHIWHRVVPHLVESYSVVLIDLRGYGASSKPAHVSAYAKSAMARDCIAVMDQLGFTDSFFVCAHDRGARVTHKLCVDYPRRVRKAMLLDICPTLAMYTKTDFDFAKAYFHWFFLIQREPLPETLINGRPREFAEMFMGGRQTDALGIFDKGNFEYYAKVLGEEDAVHAMCQDYRASATLDLDEAREDLAAGRRFQCPLMVLWGKHGVVEKCFDALAEWKAVAAEGAPVTGHSVDSGHYVPEQAPDEVVRAIKEFLV